MRFIIIALITCLDILELSACICPCDSIISISDIVKITDYIAVGEVVSIDKIVTDSIGKNFKIHQLKVVLSVKHVYRSRSKKMKKLKNIIIFTGIGGGDCGYPFIIGKQYFVFAYFDSPHRRLRSLYTDVCTETTDNIGKTELFFSLSPHRRQNKVPIN